MESFNERPEIMENSGHFHVEKGRRLFFFLPFLWLFVLFVNFIPKLCFGYKVARKFFSGFKKRMSDFMRSLCLIIWTLSSLNKKKWWNPSTVVKSRPKGEDVEIKFKWKLEGNPLKYFEAKLLLQLRGFVWNRTSD